MSSLAVVFLVDCFLTRYLHRLRKKHERTKKSQLEGQQMLLLGQTGPGAVVLPMRKTVESLERDEELDRLEEERLDEKSRELEVMIIEGGIV